MKCKLRSPDFAEFEQRQTQQHNSSGSHATIAQVASAGNRDRSSNFSYGLLFRSSGDLTSPSEVVISGAIVKSPELFWSRGFVVLLDVLQCSFSRKFDGGLQVRQF